MKTKLGLKKGAWIRFNKPLVPPETIGPKKALVIFLMAMSTYAALGQGRVRLHNDAGCVIQLTSDPSWLFEADGALAGQPIPTTGPLPSGITMVAGLYAGTSSTSLALVRSVALNPVGGTGQTSGLIAPTSIILPFPGGSLAYMQVKVWDSVFSNYEAQVAAAVPDYLGYKQHLHDDAGHRHCVSVDPHWRRQHLGGSWQRDTHHCA